MFTAKVVLAVAAAALMSSTALAGHKNFPLRASGVVGSKFVKGPARTQPASEPQKGLCKTGFGNPTSTPDGIIAWNDTSGSSFDTGGAADFTCKDKKTTIKTVSVRGYFGAVQEQFNVTFFANDKANGSDEPNDAKVECSYTGLLGAAGGQYPTDVTTKLKLKPACKLKKGKHWVAVQNNDSAGPWYWMVQDAQGGTTNADWIDRHSAFTSACTAFDNDLYLVDCLGYTYPDWMLVLN